jgi:hypothetical protein
MDHGGPPVPSAKPFFTPGRDPQAVKPWIGYQRDSSHQGSWF